MKRVRRMVQIEYLGFEKMRSFLERLRATENHRPIYKEMDEIDNEYDTDVEYSNTDEPVSIGRYRNVSKRTSLNSEWLKYLSDKCYRYSRVFYDEFFIPIFELVEIYKLNDQGEWKCTRSIVNPALYTGEGDDMKQVSFAVDGVFEIIGLEDNIE